MHTILTTMTARTTTQGTHTNTGKKNARPGVFLFVFVAKTHRPASEETGRKGDDARAECRGEDV